MFQAQKSSFTYTVSNYALRDIGISNIDNSASLDHV